MELREKEQTRLKLATCIRKIIDHNKSIDESNKQNGIQDVSIVDSLRKLEAASGLSFNLIQSIAAGKRDPSFTSLITVIESLNMSFSDFVIIYEGISNEEIEALKKNLELGRKKWQKTITCEKV